jgi:hypothetical protein
MSANIGRETRLSAFKFFRPSSKVRTTSALHSQMELDSLTTSLVELRCTFYWDGAKSHRAFRPLVFAAKLNFETKHTFFRSLDCVCLTRIRDATRLTAYGLCHILNYEVERYFVWKGFEEARLSASSLTECEVQDQAEMLRKRGFQDWIRVDMAIEIQARDGMMNGED